MIVNRENFEHHLPLIEETIQSADFISLDAEFSGKYILIAVNSHNELFNLH